VSDTQIDPDVVGGASVTQIDPDVVGGASVTPGAPVAAPMPAPDATPPDAAPQDSGMLEMLAAMKKPTPAPAPGAAKLPPKGGSGPRAQSNYRRAGAPLPAKELTWGETGQQALLNAIPSGLSAVTGMFNAVTHPQETLNSLGQIAAGAGSQIAGAAGAKQDPKQKAKDEALISALENHYKQGYGSVAGFKQNLATDPFGVAMDASTVLGGAGGILGKVGEVGNLGKVGELAGAVGKGMTKVGSAIDPVQNAVRVARFPGKIASGVLQKASSVTTGVPDSALSLVKTVGASSDPAVHAAYKQFVTGQGTAADLADAAHAALKSVRDDVSANYLKGRSGLNSVTPSFDPIDQAFAKARGRTQMGGPQFQAATGQFQDANDALDDAQRLVDGYRNSPDPIHTSLDGVDNLKQALWDKADSLPNGSAAQNAVKQVWAGAKQALTDADPEYAKLMEKYQAGLNNTRDLTKTFGLGQTATASQTLAKSLKGLSTSPKSNLLQQLIAKDPRIGGMLAGAAVQPWHSGGRSLVEAAYGSIAPTFFHNPALALATAPAALAASSPRLAGAMTKLSGAASGQLQNAQKIGSLAAKGAYYGTRPEELQGADAAPGGDVGDAVMQTEGTGRNPNSSATGPGQFLTRTFVDSVKKYHPEVARGLNDQQIAALHGTPQGDALQADMSPKFDRDNAAGLQAQGINPTPGRIKLAHVLGPAGAHRLLTAPDDNAPAERYIDPRAVAANPSIFRGKTVGEVEQWAENLMQQAARPQRASGGKVQDVRRHEYLVSRLLNAAKDAKKQTDKTTEPLLNVPDEHIVKALDVAQRAI